MDLSPTTLELSSTTLELSLKIVLAHNLRQSQRLKESSKLLSVKGDEHGYGFDAYTQIGVGER